MQVRISREQHEAVRVRRVEHLGLHTVRLLWDQVCRPTPCTGGLHLIQAAYAMAAEAAAQVVPVAAALHIVVTRQHLGQFESRIEMCHLYDCGAMLLDPVTMGHTRLISALILPYP